MLYKDACNSKSNQKNLGTIKSSNLCTEIIEYSSPTEFAVCNLASIGLSKYVDSETKVFDYDKLYKVSKVITKNLNKIISYNQAIEKINNNFLYKLLNIFTKKILQSKRILKNKKLLIF